MIKNATEIEDDDQETKRARHDGKMEETEDAMASLTIENVEEPENYIEITMWNFEKATATAGSHVINLKGNYEDYYAFMLSKRGSECSAVTDLVVDYHGIESSKINDAHHFIEIFTNLHSLMIIRCVDSMHISIPSSMENLSSLKVYTRGYRITLDITRRIDNVQLYLKKEGGNFIYINTPSTVYTQNFKYNMEGRILTRFGNTDYTVTDDITMRDFVPKPEFI